MRSPSAPVSLKDPSWGRAAWTCLNLANEVLWVGEFWFVESWLLHLCPPPVDMDSDPEPTGPPALPLQRRASYSPPWSTSRSRGAAQPRGMLTPGPARDTQQTVGPSLGMKGPWTASL